jgi:thioredoxin-related protein
MNKAIVNIFLFTCLASFICVNSFAQEAKSNILLIFTADWCKYCNMAKTDMYSNPETQTLLRNYEIIETDFDVDKDMVKGYNIKSIPVFIILDEDKKIVSRQNGYRNIKDLNRFLEKRGR